MMFVKVVGFEPTALAPQTQCSGQTELHPEYAGARFNSPLSAAVLE